MRPEERFLSQMIDRLSADPDRSRKRLERGVRRAERLAERAMTSGKRVRAEQVTSAIVYAKAQLLILDGLRAGAVTRVLDGNGEQAWAIAPELVARWFPHIALEG